MKEVSLYESNIDFSGYQSDIKPIVLYLPQFHEIPENDAWWGKGFTEWTNVKKAQPRFSGHYQPRIPDKDWGYYDLTDVHVLERQAKLAKSHGIHAFGVYYYWFSGKRLLEKPIGILLEHPEIDFPFFLIWANENWSRRWDGKDASILIKQDYKEEDPVRFMQDLKKYLDDPRYMRVNGKPVIGIYNPCEVPNVANVLSIWRETAEKLGIGPIQIWSCIADRDAEAAGIADVIDAEYEFPPRGKGYVPYKKIPNNGIIWDYQSLVDSAKNYEVNDLHPVYRGTMLAWDNSARKKTDYHLWDGYSHRLFYQWNRIVISYTRKHYAEENRFIFVNAWNEWGEGTYLEPDETYGYAAINALSKAIFDLSYDDETLMQMGNAFYKRKDWAQNLEKKVNIAVQIHLFYLELIPEFLAKLLNIQHPFDLYVSTDSEYKAAYFKRKFEEAQSLHQNAKNLFVEIGDNRGRDVLPFLRQMHPVYNRYKYICHIHTKKSKHNTIGDIWRNYLLMGLMGSEAIVDDILYLMESDLSVGIVYPDTYQPLKPYMEWGSNYENVMRLSEKMGMNLQIKERDGLEKLQFPCGDMFWARTDAVRQIFAYAIEEEESPEETGQLDGTIMHAIERMWSYTAKFNGYRTVQTEPVSVSVVTGALADVEMSLTLNRIVNSRMWRLVQKYYWLRDKIFPKGSKRRKIVKRIVDLF